MIESEARKCPGCRLDRPASEFSGGPSARCERCKSASAAWARGDKYLSRSIRADLKAELKAAKTRKCRACKLRFPVAEFDGEDRACRSCRDRFTLDKDPKVRRQRHLAYKQKQRRKEAEKAGRSYETRDEIDLRAGLRRVDEKVKSDCAKAWMEFRRRYRKTQAERYRTDPGYREQKRAEYRRHYREHGEQERRRVQVYKHSNPGKVARWQGKRGRIEAERNDGSLTTEVIRSMFGAAKSCPYCGVKLTGRNKALDHIIPLADGGWHSVVNVVISCKSCNHSKGARPFSVWLERIAEPYRTRCMAMYRKRYGSTPDQPVMAFEFSLAC